MARVRTCSVLGRDGPASAVVDAGDDEAKAGPFGPRLRWCSARTRVGARQPEVTAAACAQWWSRRNKGAGTAAPSVCVHGIQHSRGRGIAAMLAKLRRSRATMASGGNRKRTATTFGSCTKTVEQRKGRGYSSRYGSSWPSVTRRRHPCRRRPLRAHGRRLR